VSSPRIFSNAEIIAEQDREYEESLRKDRERQDSLVSQLAAVEQEITNSGSVDDERLCVICMDRHKTHIFIPCCHFCACEECAERVGLTCPKCRVIIVERRRVF
jgi:E3 ubiquitin-protein ligase MUL1